LDSVTCSPRRWSSIDVLGYRKWAFFFVVIGMNAIAIYFLQTIVDFDAIAKLFVPGIRERSGVIPAPGSPLWIPRPEVAASLVSLPS
jgi:hypothetical protein